MPAQIKREYRQLKLRFLTAENLPNMDLIGTIDFYIKLEFGGKVYKTKPVVAVNKVCSVFFEFWIPLQWPLSTDRFVLKFFDSDSEKVSDPILCSMHFSLRELCALGMK